MTIGTILLNLVKGLKDVISVTGVVRDVLAGSIADGLHEGVRRATPLLAKYAVVTAIMIAGVGLLGFGLGSAADAFFAHPGVGFILVGVLFLVGGGIFLLQKE